MLFAGFVAGLDAEVFFAAVGAGEPAELGGVPGEEGLLEAGLEHLMALGADVGHSLEVEAADPDPHGHHQGQAGGEGPPDVLDDAIDQGADCHKVHEDAQAQHEGVGAVEFAVVFHFESYIADGFQRDAVQTFQLF